MLNKICSSIKVLALVLLINLNSSATIVNDYNLNNSFFLSPNSNYDVGIIYVSEESKDVSSMFGHSSIVFIDNEDFYNSIVLSFLADVDKSDSFFSYIYKGITGKYDGVFHKMPIYNYLNEYSKRERRNVYLFKFKSIDIKKLIKNISSRESTSKKYLFFTNNCSSYMDLVIQDSFADGFNHLSVDRYSKVFQPYSLINKYRNDLNLYKVFYSLDERFYSNKSKISEVAFKQFEDSYKLDMKFINELNSKNLSDFYDLISNGHVSNGKEVIDSFPHVRDYDFTEIEYRDVKKPNFKISLGLRNSEDKVTNTIKVDLLSRKIFESDFDSNSIKEIELLSSEFEFKIDDFVLSKFTILKTRNIVDFSWPFYNLSSSFEISIFNNKDVSFLNYNLGLSKKNNYMGQSLLIGPKLEYQKNRLHFFENFEALTFIKYRDFGFFLGLDYSISNKDYGSNYFLEFNYVFKQLILKYDLKLLQKTDDLISSFNLSYSFK